MKWFRSNIRHGSRLALFGLAIQFLLSFGHFHGAAAGAATASANAQQSGLHAAADFAAAHLAAVDKASRANPSGRARLRTSSDREPDGQPTHDCAICAVMALASATVVPTPTPHHLPAPQAAAFTHLAPDAGFFRQNLRRVAFQPRAPPIG
jgi:hypothetical protein